MKRTKYAVYGYLDHPLFCFSELISRHRWWITAVAAAWWAGLTRARNGSWIVAENVVSLPIARLKR